VLCSSDEACFDEFHPLLLCIFDRPQAMLDGIAVSQPQPKIPPELIKFLGKTFNAWQVGRQAGSGMQGSLSEAALLYSLVK
jgi:hypothetical protein